MVIVQSPVHDAFPAGDDYRFFARRPVFGPLQQLMAYDIVHCGAGYDGDLATCMSTRMDVLMAGRMVFVAVVREVLLEQDKLPAAAEDRQIVMVVAADIHVDDELLTAVNCLVNKGYLLALADFDYGRNNNALLPYADFIRLSIKGSHDALLQDLLASLHEFHVRVIAEDVDTPAQFEHARAMGFDGFAGDFYCLPQGLEAGGLTAATTSLLQLAVLVQAHELDISAMEQLISRDVALSYCLLRYINSAAFALRRKVESIRHAIVLLGLDEIRKWSALVAVSCASNKSDELIRMALWRASMCELLCEESGQGNPGTAFIVGLFSLLDAMFDQPLDTLLAQLPLADDIKAALLQGRGDYAGILACVQAYGRGDWPAVKYATLMPAHIGAVYLRALRRADKAMTGLNEHEAGMVSGPA